jgi:predicted  nucleic acid-binding Zn-ribbon protein
VTGQENGALSRLTQAITQSHERQVQIIAEIGALHRQVGALNTKVEGFHAALDRYQREATVERGTMKADLAEVREIVTRHDRELQDADDAIEAAQEDASRAKKAAETASKMADERTPTTQERARLAWIALIGTLGVAAIPIVGPPLAAALWHLVGAVYAITRAVLAAVGVHLPPMPERLS